MRTASFASQAVSLVAVLTLVFGLAAPLGNLVAAVPACPDITGGAGEGTGPIPDGNVDASDFSYLAAAIGSGVYDPLADLNGDGFVNQQDAAIWEGYRGQTAFNCQAYVQAQSQALATPASLTIAKTDGVTSSSAGAATTYIITVTNTGGTAATNVRVTDTLPGNYGTVTSISDGGVMSGTTVTWDNVLVPANGSKALSFAGKIAASLAVGTTTIANTATLGCTVPTTAAPCAYAGTATDTTTVSVAPVAPGQPALTLSKLVNVATAANAGDIVTYTVTLSNSASATAAAKSVVLTDTLPTGFTFHADNQTVSSFSMGDLAPGDVRTLSYDVKIGDAVTSGAYENIVVAKAANADSLQATASVQVRSPIVLGESVEESTDEAPPVQVLAETGPGAVDFAIGSGAFLLTAFGAFLARRRLTA